MELADLEEEAEAVEDLRILADFLVDASLCELNISPAWNLRRAYIHYAAEYVGFSNPSVEEESNPFS